jgi:hypothetical protein
MMTSDPCPLGLLTAQKVRIWTARPWEGIKPEGQNGGSARRAWALVRDTLGDE